MMVVSVPQETQEAEEPLAILAMKVEMATFPGPSNTALVEMLVRPACPVEEELPGKVVTVDLA
jgi:hypothetical protein